MCSIMTRKTVPLQFIASDSSRKVTFKKRKKGLMKKVSELSTLCGIEACAIVYGPFSNEPEIWPSAAEARRTIDRFRNMSEMDRSKGMVNQQGFLRQRIGKAEAQLKKQQRENREKEVAQVMYQSITPGRTSALLGLNLSDLNELDSTVAKTLHDIEERMKLLQKEPSKPPHQQPRTQLGSGGFWPQQGFEAMTGVRVPESIQVEGQGGGIHFQSNEVMEPPPPPLSWYLDLLRPGAGGFSSKNDDEAMMMMMRPSPSSTPAAMAAALPNTCTDNVSSWSNFLYP